MKQQRKLRALLLMTALIFALALPSLATPVKAMMGGHGLDEEEAMILQRQLEIGTEIADVEGQVAAQQAEYDKLQAELEKLYAENKAEKREYELLSQRMEEASQALIDSKRMSEEASENQAKKQAEYEERLIAMFENRNTSSLEILLQSDSVAGFFTNLELIQVIADSDQEMLMELRGAAKQAEVSLAMAQVTAQRSEEVLKNSEEKLQGLENGIRLREEDFNALNVNLMNRQGEYDQLLAEEASLSDALQNVRDQRAAQVAAEEAAAEQARIEAERQQQAALTTTTAAPAVPTETEAPWVEPTTQSNNYFVVGTTTTEAEEVWTEPEPTTTEAVWTEPETPQDPAPTMSLYFPNVYSSIVTSPYGPRWGSFHTGVDFQGAFGSSIVAAASGTVVVANNPLEGQEWGGSGYGNYVVIDHGNGISTLYAHMISVQVSPGQYVNAGQQIGLCGSTGWSSGPHLHFEVRVNGTHVNPMPYLW